ncbi:2-keto-4-pentenoate hydratase [Brevibacterium sp. UCMA 11754]|uniref:2-keto-4-pentenoate hydratase n=1 Tax=Brevibacterium sp. UCMA 11754 TaxID=2749198 RepID=UPI001F1D1BD9|nr:fumarylacetoacetate hydrolase family protein [Brevibacterium sp. UCMA 11754]MCF2570783.1 fumarylacetoacetate hydrolase family protein [Brevibacterium sp. UCMA 11754]
MRIDVSAAAAALVKAHDDRQPVDTVFGGEAATAEEGFRIQQQIVRIKKTRGDKVVGFKLGNIAKAMQDKFGVDEPDYGYLLASHFLPENLPVPASDFIEPFIELEVGFVLKHELSGSHITAADVISATDYVLPALEIIDSRVKNWNIGLGDTLADSGSAGAVILGAQPRSLSDVNVSDMHGEIQFDGQTVAEGNSSAVYGSPVSAIAWLCRRIAEYGVGLRAGDLVIPGSCLAAEKMRPGTQIQGEFRGWSSVQFDFTTD